MGVVLKGVVAALSMVLALITPAAAACTVLTAPAKPNCASVTVAQIAKTYLDLYRIDGGKAVLDHSLKSGDICLPFQATDCNVPAYLMVETPDRAQLLFRRSDLKQEASAGDCVCPRSAQNTVIGAPGAGKLKECAPEMCS